MTRQVKTAKQRAEEVLGVAERRVEKLAEAEKAAQAALDEIRGDLTQAQKRFDYVKQDPALDPRAHDVELPLDDGVGS